MHGSQFMYSSTRIAFARFSAIAIIEPGISQLQFLIWIISSGKSSFLCRELHSIRKSLTKHVLQMSLPKVLLEFSSPIVAR